MKRKAVFSAKKGYYFNNVVKSSIADIFFQLAEDIVKKVLKIFRMIK